jgi:hypothetical protein
MLYITWGSFDNSSCVHVWRKIIRLAKVSCPRHLQNLHVTLSDDLLPCLSFTCMLLLQEKKVSATCITGSILLCVFECGILYRALHIEKGHHRWHASRQSIMSLTTCSTGKQDCCTACSCTYIREAPSQNSLGSFQIYTNPSLDTT